MQKKSPRRSMHLTLDGYGCSQKRLANLDAIYEFLENCPDLIKMTKIMPPYVFKYHGKVPEDGGISGFVLIQEEFRESGQTKRRGGGHVSLHTFPARNYLSLDIFSTKDSDFVQAIAYAVETFGIARHEVNLLDRGREFPREVRTAEILLRQELEQMRGKRFAEKPLNEVV